MHYPAELRDRFHRTYHGFINRLIDIHRNRIPGTPETIRTSHLVREPGTAAGSARFLASVADEFSSWTPDARDAVSKLQVCYSEGGAARRTRN